MAILVSPGVDVQIIDESFYGSAGAGTIPLIVMATAANKPSPSGTGYAPYTLPNEAGKLFLATSQRELVQNFGNPKFYSVQGTQLHGHELNEYGLHAAYQYLGIANRAYVLRADIDTAQLEPSDSAPRGAPAPGTYWLDLNETVWGLFQSNGNPIAGSAWEAVKVRAVTPFDTEDKDVTREISTGQTQTFTIRVPKNTYGNDGDFAIVTEVRALSTDNKFYEKINGQWLEIGTFEWKEARPTLVKCSHFASVEQDSSIIINGVTIAFPKAGGSNAADVKAAFDQVKTTTVANENPALEDVVAEFNGTLIFKEVKGGDIVFTNGAKNALATMGIVAATYKGVSVARTNDAQYPEKSVIGDLWVKGTSPNRGANWKVKYYNAGTEQWTTVAAPMYPFQSHLEDGNPQKDLAAFAAFGVPTTGAIYVGYEAEYTNPDSPKPVWVTKQDGAQVIRRWSGVRWESLVYEASFEAPSTEPEAGTMWYSTDFRVDIMVNHEGRRWVGYGKKFENTDPRGTIIAGSQPMYQSDGAPLVNNDLWLDTSDLENYPALYRYNATTKRWKRIDNTDQTTPFGIVFADARANAGVQFRDQATGAAIPKTYSDYSEKIEDMLESDYLDPDAPDPRTFPAGTLLFNTRYSTYNVKEWRPRHFVEGNFDPETNYGQVSYDVGDDYTFSKLVPEGTEPDAVSQYVGRWVTASGNKVDGSPYMGRKAQRIIIVRAMSAAVQQNDDLRSELVYFNLMSAPGYPEMIDELVMLNTDQKEVAFIVADTPARLKPLGSEIEGWAKNAKLAASNGEDGLTTGNIYAAVYYPWGLSTNIDGGEVMIPPSTIALRTMAYNDQVAYPWFAPAGFQRGLVTNATTVGYLTDENEFKPVLLNPGQRDVLYVNKINPIAFIPGRGLVVYGQKTLSPLESALDRINVARLANYLKYNLDVLMKPFLFEQNDQQTRDSVKLTTERFLTGLVGLRALEDFAVVCDEQNNTPERRDRNELWVDILIKPIKAIEFIYVPVRIRNSGDDLEL